MNPLSAGRWSSRTPRTSTRRALRSPVSIHTDNKKEGGWHYTTRPFCSFYSPLRAPDKPKALRVSSLRKPSGSKPTNNWKPLTLSTSEVEYSSV